MTMQHEVTRTQWEMNNFVVTDDTFSFPNMEKMEELHKTQPWKKSPRYFQRVKVSILAAMQMITHAQRGSPNVTSSNDIGGANSSQYMRNEPRRENWFEVMGLMLGHFTENEMIVTSAFALPVDASEVECAMNDASQLYMLDYIQYHQRGGTQEGCIGWYHSHPGYTCFLSGTDVSTQQLGQTAQDPWVAIVVDPVRSISTGKLDMKAFRTFPDEYAAQLQRDNTIGVRKTLSESLAMSTRLPSERIREYGVHAHRYYELPITLVRTKSDEAVLDSLWSRYWKLTFRSNPLTSNRQLMTQQMHQLSDILENGLARSRQKGTKNDGMTHGDSEELKEESLNIRYLTSALASEVALGCTHLVVKSSVFQL